ncbi:WD40 repeat-like protein [Metschnikowia bicuspidata]|uniref:WD40 repeat-like protein n=1 Tax=Metschnikowia bicuspidata TaxID=27322 RepID=A0A4P9ZER3_9ASCO|nr:WD40 repeat-like protein [Metschnikowia bicuspidata]
MRAFQTGHEELIHDMKYDFYGRYVATASSDQHIKVFDLDAASSTWFLNDLWKAHDSLVVKLSWAHPEFSSAKILASCSYDRTVKIWQEMPDELHGSGRRWTKLATLAVELYGPIYDVQFAPPHLGLKLACVGSDGIVRMYESMEPSDLTVWSLTAEIPILSLQLPAKNLQSSFCIEWCPSKFAKFEKFAVIALDQGFIYSVATPLSDIHTDHSLQTSFVKVCNLPEHNGLIRSISWAPSMGRSYHLIATGCKDGLIQIFKAYEQDTGDFKIETVARLNNHQQEVWRVEWNSTGTILASAGDDGRIRLWKCNHMNEWKCMSVINSSNLQDDRAVDDGDAAFRAGASKPAKLTT